MRDLSRAKDERGASAVELALVLSVIVLLFFGMIQLGLAYHTQLGLQSAAREGGRLAALPYVTAAQVRDRVQSTMSGIDPASVACPPGVGQYCVTVLPELPEPCTGRSGDTVTVAVTSRVRVDVPLWASPVVEVTGRGVFRCE